mgnify:CR=1 FL=1
MIRAIIAAPIPIVWLYEFFGSIFSFSVRRGRIVAMKGLQKFLVLVWLVLFDVDLANGFNKLLAQAQHFFLFTLDIL